MSTQRNAKPTIEAYGVKGMKSTPWRKTFVSVQALNDWAEFNDAQVQGTRDLEAASRGSLSPAISEHVQEAFDPDQPRDAHGMWTDGGHGSIGGGTLFHGDGETVDLYRGMSQEEYKDLVAHGRISTSPYNKVSKNVDTAKFYASQHDEPGVVVKFKAPVEHVAEDEIYKGDFKVTKEINVGKDFEIVHGNPEAQ